MRPILIVLPAYNNTSPQDSGDYGLAIQLTNDFHNELLDGYMFLQNRFAFFDKSKAGRSSFRST